jgi:carbamate kinase
MKLVVALGGNALLQRGEPLDAGTPRRNIQRAVRALAPLAHAHELVITHGNGPQVGLLALQNAAYRAVQAYPLDVLGAESEGMIGYLIEEDLRNQLPGREVATLLTQVVVDATDPAFRRPTKPIGPGYSPSKAQRLAAERGWTVGPDSACWRRLVASPEPTRIVETAAIRLLVDAGVIVICAGGGGIPVVEDDCHGLWGVEAVVDKDLSAALLAMALGADALLLLTDVDAVYEAWGTRDECPIHHASPARLRRLPWAAGTMGPKVEAACRFVEASGAFAAIGALEDAAALLHGRAGTRIAVPAANGRRSATEARRSHGISSPSAATASSRVTGN